MELEAEKELEAQNHQELQKWTCPLKSQISNLNYNVLLDEYSKAETLAEDGVETITAHEDVEPS